MILLIGSIQLGLLYGIMALGIYITFRILNLPDLTVDGSFTLGMAITAVLTVNGHPYLALLAAILWGAAAGLVTGFLQTKVGIHPILAGILVMTGLYSVNLFIMGGKSNISLMGSDTIFIHIQKLFAITLDLSKTLLGILVCTVSFLILSVLFKTRLGLSIRATGDNEDMVRSSSINADFSKCVGLAIGNGCVSLSGGLISQYQMFSDVSSGTGMVVIGLASVIIGETIFGRRSVTIGFLSAAIGSILYRIIIAQALSIDLFPAYGLKLVSAVIVGIALSIPAIKTAYDQAKVRKGGK
ncbi:MAG: ABC-type uncharacterized transport system, permease component [Anaerocolumna sp.]|jgi:putative ABC transport system permease protein|nr:ABC-type uncharacterized transport system, permease component [Anaerocolumna sp.]